jgi:hypothetical protein
VTRRTVRTLPVIAACLAKPFTGKRLLLLLYWQVQLDVPQLVSLCHHDMRASMHSRQKRTTMDSCGRRKSVARIIASATT